MPRSVVFCYAAVSIEAVINFIIMEQSLFEGKAFNEKQYEEIWNMIFQITGYPSNHPKHNSQSTTNAKPEEPLPIKVHAIHALAENSNDAASQIITSRRIPPEKYEPIKKAIERCLAGEKDIVTPYDVIAKCDVTQYWMNKYYELLNSNRKQTSDELLEAQQKAFYAGRETDKPTTRVSYDPFIASNKYPTFSHYYETLNK